MKHPKLVISLLLTVLATTALQAQNRYVHSKEGTLLGRRVDAIVACATQSHKDWSRATKVTICKCMVDLMNHHFSDKQIERHARDGVVGLFGEDSSLANQVRDCSVNNEKGWSDFQQEYALECKKTLQEATPKPLDPAKIDEFGHCQLEMVLSNEAPNIEIKKLDDPNSDSFQKIVKKCGSPFKG